MPERPLSTIKLNKTLSTEQLQQLYDQPLTVLEYMTAPDINEEEILTTAIHEQNAQLLLDLACYEKLQNIDILPLPNLMDDENEEQLQLQLILDEQLGQVTFSPLFHL